MILNSFEIDKVLFNILERASNFNEIALNLVVKKCLVQALLYMILLFETDQNIVNSEAGKKSTGNPRLDKFAKGMTLAVAYAANIGGTASLIGTAPNYVMKGHADEYVLYY